MQWRIICIGIGTAPAGPVLAGPLFSLGKKAGFICIAINGVVCIISIPYKLIFRH